MGGPTPIYPNSKIAIRGKFCIFLMGFLFVRSFLVFLKRSPNSLLHCLPELLILNQ